MLYFSSELIPAAAGFYIIFVFQLAAAGLDNERSVLTKGTGARDIICADPRHRPAIARGREYRYVARGAAFPDPGASAPHDARQSVSVLAAHFIIGRAMPARDRIKVFFGADLWTGHAFFNVPPSFRPACRTSLLARDELRQIITRSCGFQPQKKNCLKQN